LWSEEEDRLLRASIKAKAKLGANKMPWGEIAKDVSGRNAKEFRDRWQSINESVFRREWTLKEDLKLLNLQKLYQKPVGSIFQRNSKGEMQTL